MAGTRPSFLKSTRARTVALGIALTLIIVMIDRLGALAALEQFSLDTRIGACQFFTPKPTQDLVHLDIDDAALAAIGRWPWKRSELALVIDELRWAGAKVIAIDVLFPEAQEAEWRPNPDGTFSRIDHDGLLAAAMARHGGVILAADPDFPPVSTLRQSALDLGLVGYYKTSEAVARTRSLLYEKDGKRLVQMGLLLALRMRGQDPATVTVRGDALTVTTPDGVQRIALVAQRNDTSGYRAQTYVPWFGAAGADAWKTMYDWPAHERGAQHYPIVRLHEIAAKSQAQRAAVVAAMQEFAPARLNDLAQAENADAQTGGTGATDRVFAAMLQEIAPIHEAYEQMDDPSDEDQRLLAILRDVSNAVANYHMTEYRRELRQVFAGKAVLVGFTATAAYDEVPTPLHAKAPGVVVHGAMFNAAMTGQWWAQAPPWLDVLLIVAMGISATGIVVTLSPAAAALSVAGLAAMYALVNGVLLFDYANIVTTMAGPLAAMTMVWAGGTVTLFVLEQLERARITRRFRSYVDPVLVDYVLAHPDQTGLSGEQRELTVVFTDLAGFTTLSEKLKADVVPLLSEYLQRMVPLVRQRRGYVNKFLGDGMMFFYGAPLENSGHAIDAVATVLDMQKNLSEFNEVLQGRGLSTLAMRAGIGSGPMIVGDAGPADACDYTVIGDTVNLAARLESANKATGTWILMNQCARDLVGDRFLVRPIANLQVVGKSEGVFVYEPLCAMEEATPTQQQLAELTTGMVERFLAGDFKACLTIIEEMNDRLGPSKLTALYGGHCREYIAHAPADFRGIIALSEK